jgi:hypothetical protein
MVTVRNILSLKFYGGLPENINTIKTAVKKMLTAFGSTYICEKSFFSHELHKKINKFCLRLSDELLCAALRVNLQVSKHTFTI